MHCYQIFVHPHPMCKRGMAEGAGIPQEPPCFSSNTVLDWLCASYRCRQFKWTEIGFAESGWGVTVEGECVFWWQSASALGWNRVKPYSKWEGKPLIPKTLWRVKSLHELVWADYSWSYWCDQRNSSGTESCQVDPWPVGWGFGEKKEQEQSHEVIGYRCCPSSCCYGLHVLHTAGKSVLVTCYKASWLLWSFSSATTEKLNWNTSWENNSFLYIQINLRCQATFSKQTIPAPCG